MKFWYQNKVINKRDDATSLVLHYLPENNGNYALWINDGLRGPFNHELDAIFAYLKEYYGIEQAKDFHYPDAQPDD